MVSVRSFAEEFEKEVDLRWSVDKDAVISGSDQHGSS